MKEGIILSGVGGLYEVRGTDETVYCRARGAFRKEGVRPLLGDRVRYSEEGLVLKFPLRAGQELFWRDIRRVEAVPMKRPDRGGWKRLRIYTGDGVYRLDLEVLSHGRDGFVTELFKAVQNYQIPCVKVKK